MSRSPTRATPTSKTALLRRRTPPSSGRHVQQRESTHRTDPHAGADEVGDRRGQQQLGIGVLQGPAQPAHFRPVQFGTREHGHGVDAVGLDHLGRVVEATEHR